MSIQREAFRLKKKAAWIACIVGLALSAGAIYCAELPVRALGMAAEKFGTDEQTARLLITLSHALIRLNWLLLLPGTLLTALPIYRFQVTKRVWLKILCILGILILLPVLTLFSMITMYVNKIPIFTLLRILIQWAMAGA